MTGLVMTKLDGTARGGILAAIAAKYRLPVHFIGVGEGVDDLAPFSARDFARALAGDRTGRVRAPWYAAPIHPGEHLAEELREIGMSAAALARQIDVPVNRITGIINGQRGRYGRHRAAPRSLVWHQPGILAQPAITVRIRGREVGDRVKKLPSGPTEAHANPSTPADCAQVQMRGGMGQDTLAMQRSIP